MAACLNAIPLEEGSVTRRPGTRYIAFTKGGAPAVLWKFSFTSSAPYNMEFTAGFLRLSYGPGLVLEPTTQNVVSAGVAPTWLIGTTYAIYALVLGSDNNVYFSVAGGNVGNDPVGDAGVHWTFVGPNAAAITTAANHGWATGDEVQFNLPVGDITDFGTATLLNRQFLITVGAPNSFLIADSITNAPIDGATLTLGAPGMFVSRVLRYSTPYLASELEQIRVVQAVNNEINQLFILHPNHQPQVLTAVANPNAALNTYGTFTLGVATFLDGPYLDPPSDGATLTPTGLTGLVTLNIGFNAWSSTTTYGVGDTVSFGGAGYISLIDSNINNEPDTSSLAWQPQSLGADVGAAGFRATDVGRSIRMFSQPANWSSVTGYTKGNIVTFDGAYWTALQANTNVHPGLDIVNWAVDPTAAVWTWGRIQTVASASQITLQLLGGALLYSLPITDWQLGRYSNTTGWPSNGTYFEGRLWLVGLQGNHFDGSESNITLNWAPTGQDGTVADNNAISETLNDKEVDAIFWMLPSAGGIVMGTQGGEWVITASALNDPLTPTSVQAKKVTKYGQENIQPEHAPLAFLTVQRYARKLLEYVADPYTGKFSASNIGISAQNLIQDGGGIAQVAYQQERVPICWVRLNDGSLVGVTYKRVTPFGYSPVEFAAWHQHTLGTGRNVISVSGGAAAGGQTDTLTMVTQDPVSGLCWLELLTDVMDEDADITDAWFLDGADLPFLVQLNPSGLSGVRLYGYHYLAGQTIQVWAAGLDMGNIAVAADGHIDLPFGGDATGLFTLARMQVLSTNYQSLFPDKASFISSGAIPPPGPPTLTGISGFITGPYNGGLIGVDWTNNFVYVPGLNGLSVNGVSQYALQSRAAVGGLGLLAANAVAPSSGIVVGQDGNAYWRGGGGNTGPFLKMTGGALLASFGASGGSIDSSQNGICYPHSMAAVYAGDQFIVSANALVDTQFTGLTVVDGTTMKFITQVYGNGKGVNVCAGRQTTDGLGHFYGEAYSMQDNCSLISNQWLSATGNSPFCLWRLSINKNPPGAAAVAMSLVATLTPQNIDPNWLAFNASAGIAFDTTDNNVLAFFQTGTLFTWQSGGNAYALNTVVLGSNGHAYVCILSASSNVTSPVSDGGTHWTDLGVPPTVTNTCYLVKLNSLTGAVMWTIAVPNVPVRDFPWAQSLIQNGRLAVLFELGGANQEVMWIDTIAGQIITTTAIVDCIPNGNGQVWGPGGLIFGAIYTDIGGSPVPIAPVTSSGFNGWGIFAALPAVPTQLLAPFVAGYTYTTQGQILRPVAPQEAGAANGPALGKTRRTHMVAYLLHGAQGVSFGTDFDGSLHACNFMLNSGSVTPLPITSLYNDIYWDTIEDNYSFNGQPSFQITRPYPATILAIEAFVRTSDR